MSRTLRVLAGAAVILAALALVVWATSRTGAPAGVIAGGLA